MADWVVGLPSGDALHLAWLAAAAGVLAGVAGGAGVLVLRRRSLSAHLAWIAVVSLGAAAGGAIAAANARFISTADLRALVVIVVAAAGAGIIVALALGRRLAAGSRRLAEAARCIGEGVGMPALGDLPTAELGQLAGELRAMCARVEAARQRERTLDASRRELVAWVSHDLRTPLAGIRAMTEALEDEVVDDPEQVRRYHRAILLEANRLAGLVDDLFELSRINAGALRLQLEPVYLSELVSDALASAAPIARAKGVRLEGAVPEEIPAVSVSPAEMTRVLRNLLENAIRHTPSDGAVRVEAAADEAGAWLHVADTCGGIPEADVDRVFELAFRGEAARRADGNRAAGAGSGAGLGLAIARGIVQAHQGEISVRNESGGCRFSVRLPPVGRGPGEAVMAGDGFQRA
ncbi:MAG TPA: HAMP domain-containing sensor histidine kinase [Actinomycetota bacterium]